MMAMTVSRSNKPEVTLQNNRSRWIRPLLHKTTLLVGFGETVGLHFYSFSLEQY